MTNDIKMFHKQNVENKFPFIYFGLIFLTGPNLYIYFSQGCNNVISKERPMTSKKQKTDNKQSTYIQTITQTEEEEEEEEVTVPGSK